MMQRTSTTQLFLRILRVHGAQVDVPSVPVPGTGMELGSAGDLLLDLAWCVAAHHAAIIPAGEGFQLTPRDSRVVTILNRQIIPEEECRPLTDGDLIHLGFVTIEVSMRTAFQETVKRNLSIQESLESWTDAMVPLKDNSSRSLGGTGNMAFAPLDLVSPEQTKKEDPLFLMPSGCEKERKTEKVALFPKISSDQSAEQSLLELLRQDSKELASEQGETESLADMLSIAATTSEDDIVTQLAHESEAVLQGRFPETFMQNSNPGFVPAYTLSPETTTDDPLACLETDLSLNDILEGTLTIDDVLEGLGRDTETPSILDPLSDPSDPLALLAGQESISHTIQLTDTMLRDHHRPGIRTPYLNDVQGAVWNSAEDTPLRNKSDAPRTHSLHQEEY